MFSKLTTPKGTPAYYEFDGTGTVTGLLSGVVPQSLASPSGIVTSWEPALSRVFRAA